MSKKVYETNDQRLEFLNSAVRNFDKKNPDDMYHLIEIIEDENVRITGWDRKKNMKVGDIIIVEHEVYEILDISYRDHKGVFKDANDKVGTFFEIKGYEIKNLIPKKTL